MTQGQETQREDDLLLLNALLDGELDASSALEIERKLAQDPRLAGEFSRLSALRAALRDKAPREAAPAALRARLEALAESPTVKAPAKVRRGPPSWRVFASSLAATAALTLALDRLVLVPNAPDASLQAIVAAHMRGQIADQPVDVASSDRHTVKPWLARKLPVATVVVDLAGEGFPLIGGRIDIVDGAPAPTLVYKRREHLISLTELPARGGLSSAPEPQTAQGYPVESWSDGDHAYVAVSDLSRGELQAFAQLIREAAAREKSRAGAAPN